MSTNIVLGCSVAVVSSAIQSLGITLQRKSHLLTTHVHRQKRNMWLAGFIMFLAANILGSLVQITTLPLIILLPLQSIGLIFNLILSCLLLPGENFTTKLGTGTVSIAIGALIIAYNGGIPPELPPAVPPSVDDKFTSILEKLTKPAFVVWFSTTIVLCGILLLLNSKLDRSRKLLKGFNYGVISGTLTAHTFLFAKSLIDVVVETLLKSEGMSILHNLIPFGLLASMLTIIGLQLTAFNLALEQMLTLILYPLCFLIYNFFNLVNDLIFSSLLAEHKMSYTQFAWIVVGLVLVLCGVVTISWDSAFAEDPESDYLLRNDRKVDSNGLMSFEQNQLLDSLDV